MECYTRDEFTYHSKQFIKMAELIGEISNHLVIK